MPKGTHLSPDEQRAIVELRKKNHSNREIGRQMKRSESMIRRFLNNPDHYYNEKKKKVKKKLRYWQAQPC
jgi:IS30 family transposase